MPTNFSLVDNPYASPEPEAAPVSRTYQRLSVALVGCSALVFLACLPWDGYYIARDGFEKADPAWGLLLIGWLGLGETPAWLANPLLFVAWYFIVTEQERRLAWGIPLAAFALSLSFLLKGDITCNEAGGRSDIIGYGYGYGLWNVSIFLAVLASLAALAELPPKLTDDQAWWAKYRKKRT